MSENLPFFHLETNSLEIHAHSPEKNRFFMRFQQAIYLHDGLFQKTEQMKMSVCRNCQKQHNLI